MEKILDKYKHDFYIIYIPSFIIENKLYWPAIIHEIGHIVIDRYNIVQKFYREVPITEYNTSAGINYFHSLEYIADYIANKYIGPIYYEICYILLYVVRAIIGSTHPPRESRLFFLKDKLPSLNINKSEQEPSHINHRTIGKIDEMIKIADEILSNKYINNEEEIEKVKHDLVSMIPPITEPSILLNVYWSNKEQILDKLTTNNIDTNINKYKQQLERELDIIIEDSIRLTNIKRTFEKMKSLTKE